MLKARTNIRNSLFCGSAVAVAMAGMLGAAPVAAQETVREGGLDIIIVTAQKREQNLQDVPVSVTAVSAELIENKRINEFADLTKAAPALTISEGANTNNSTIYLRGIGTSSFSIGVEPAVSVVIDDVAVVQQAQAFGNLSDISRIEVLRGPQGTLFGKNASAGVINIVTQDPLDHFGGGFQLTATTDEQVRAEATLSGPIGSGGSGFRLNGYYDHREGHVKNLTTGSDLNGSKAFGIRGKVELVASNNLDIRLIADYSENETQGNANTYFAVPTGAAFFGFLPIASQVAGINVGVGNNQIRLSDDPISNNKQLVLSGKATLDLGAVSLVSITSYQDWKYNFFQDLDGTNLEILTPFTGGFLQGGIAHGGPFKAHQVSQELRLVSNGGGALNYILGGYYSDSTTKRGFFRGGFSPAGNFVSLVGPLGAFNADWDAESGSRSLAAFAQVDYDLSDRTRIGAGVRLNNEKIKVSFLNNIASALPMNGGCNVACVGNDSETAITFKGSLQHDIADDVMAFASFSTGYKGQGYDVSSGFTPIRAANPISSESSRAYEIGVKSRLFDNRVQLNVTGFWTDYDDYQAQGAVIDPISGAIQLELSNVGKLRTKGVEVELSAEPVDGLRIDGSFAYVDAKIRSYPFAQCYSGQSVANGCFDVDGAGPNTDRAQDLAGARLSNAPKLSFNIGGIYDFPLSSSLDGFVSLGYRHQSKANFDLFGNPLTQQGSFGILDGSLGLKVDEGGRMKLTFFVNNILDKRYLSNLGDASALHGGVKVLTQSVPRNSRRYGGLKLKFEF